jgi:transcriptional regulator with XRE-family HTH domain
VVYKRHVSKVLQAERERIGRQIRKARLASGLSHDRIAEKAGTSRFHLIKLEKGLHMPSPELLAEIGRATGQPLSFFEDGAGDDEDEEADLPTVLQQLVVAITRDVEDRIRASRAAEATA